MRLVQLNTNLCLNISPSEIVPHDKKMYRQSYQKREIGNGWMHKSHMVESEFDGGSYDPVDSITSKFNKLLTVPEMHYTDEYADENDGEGFSIRPTFVQPSYNNSDIRKVTAPKKRVVKAKTKTREKKGEGLFFKGVPISAQDGSGYQENMVPRLSVEDYPYYEKKKPRAKLSLSARDFVMGSGLTIYD